MNRPFRERWIGRNGRKADRHVSFPRSLTHKHTHTRDNTHTQNQIHNKKHKSNVKKAAFFVSRVWLYFVGSRHGHANWQGLGATTQESERERERESVRENRQSKQD